ncbi:MAG: CopG family transcriptional regulator [Acidobacteriota bacterium]
MPQTTTMTIRLPEPVMARLAQLAKATDRTKAYLASRAVEEYVGVQEWQVSAIEEAAHEADSMKARFLDHGEVVRRIRRLAARKKK